MKDETGNDDIYMMYLDGGNMQGRRVYESSLSHSGRTD